MCFVAIYILFFLSQTDRKRRILNILISVDSTVFVVVTLGRGHPGETISSAAWRAEQKGMFFGKARPLIDWLFSPFEDGHCQLAYFYAYQKRNLPEDMR